MNITTSIILIIITLIINRNIILTKQYIISKLKNSVELLYLTLMNYKISINICTYDIINIQNEHLIVLIINI